jgi:hypothetical protein
MRRYLLLLIIISIPALAFAQDQVWLNVEAGTVFYLDPLQADWVPVTGKQQVPEQTYVLVKPAARVHLFKDAEVYTLPAGAYFYLEDVPHKGRVEVVAALTRIEAAHLPAPAARPDAGEPRRIGVTYGKPPSAPSARVIPYEAERAAAVTWFYEQGRVDAAVLSLKRLMTRYPSLYLNLSYVEQLLHGYEQLELYGFLLDEAKRLMDAEVSPDYEQTILRWHDRAAKKLLRGG